MTGTADPGLMQRLSARVEERMGLNFTQDRWPDLERGVLKAGAQLRVADPGMADPARCLARFAGGAWTGAEFEALAAHLTIGETYFQREPASFEVLEQVILPPLIAGRAGEGRNLRLWSAGCCTGEEAYSLAISCRRVVPDIESWNVSVLGTDINKAFLAKAQAAVYTPWSFREQAAWLQSRYFQTAGGDRLEVISTVRAMVEFAVLNLAEDTWPSLATHTNAMDIVFCRNVLMYFTPEYQQRVVDALYRSLADNGCLVVSPAEANAEMFRMFRTEQHASVTVYRKVSGDPSDALPVGLALAGVASWSPPAAPAPAAIRVTKAPGAPRPAAPVRVLPAREAQSLEGVRALADRGHLDEALKASLGLIDLDRCQAEAHFLQATICHELGLVREETLALNRALYLEPDFVAAHHALGALHARLGNKARAHHHFGIALGLLNAMEPDTPVPGCDGMTAARFAELIWVGRRV